jgi:gluconate 2-dehydrogenase gamma chain
MSDPTVGRRGFLCSAAAAASTVACGRTPRNGRFLSEAEIETLNAICDQIVPPDADPGGAWAGAANYIDHQLAGWFRKHRQIYRSGLKEADRRAGGAFAKSPSGRQREILLAMEKDGVTKTFFALVVEHTMQGFYGNPRHGGNRDCCSWRMLGAPISPIRAREPSL